eukprot:CAMPEP_0195606556 /NCGR_PEP_ID=MMETSP0815-20121206/7747_1 /TAXON_ID=97485 /ORGANISM="Prymnesium parvum, Strain Texoma1" /LENGTH=326 /DNA_ID=CAMNT_0040746303 /DNA_START=87 /DNA_END=1068 /DNA_ORIENTATION=-
MTRAWHAHHELASLEGCENNQARRADHHQLYKHVRCASTSGAPSVTPGGAQPEQRGLRPLEDNVADAHRRQRLEQVGREAIEEAEQPSRPPRAAEAVGQPRVRERLAHGERPRRGVARVEARLEGLVEAEVDRAEGDDADQRGGEPFVERAHALGRRGVMQAVPHGVVLQGAAHSDPRLHELERVGEEARGEPCHRAGGEPLRESGARLVGADEQPRAVVRPEADGGLGDHFDQVSAVALEESAVAAARVDGGERLQRARGLDAAAAGAADLHEALDAVERRGERAADHARRGAGGEQDLGGALRCGGPRRVLAFEGRLPRDVSLV